MSGSSSLVVYTATFGGYDRLHPAPEYSDCDFIAFTDNPRLASKGWTVRVWDNRELDSAAKNRYVKMHPHEFFPEYEYSIYIDSNIQVLGDPKQFLERFLDTASLGILKHRTRNCVYDEAVECMEKEKITRPELENLVSRYTEAGMPEKYGLTENCVIVRRHKDPALITLMSQWWNEYKNGAKRDQLSLPFLLWQSNFKYEMINLNIREPNEYFRWRRHLAELQSSIKYRVTDFLKGFEWRKYRS